jgi:hypothetical protein
MNAVRLVCVLLSVLALSCRGDGPELSEVVVVIEGDALVRASVDRLEVAMSSGSLTVPAASWALKPSETFAKLGWPASLTLVPRGNPSDTGFSLQITGYQGDKVRIQRSVVSQFVAGRSLYLQIMLEQACLDYLSCDLGYTCLAEATFPVCAAASVDASMLPEYSGHHGMVQPDGDAGVLPVVDASVDGAVTGPCVPRGIEDCYNGLDDDCNGFRDCGDVACQSTSMCVPGDDSAGILVGANDACPEGYTAKMIALQRGLSGECAGCTCTSTKTTCSASVNIYDVITDCSYEEGTPTTKTVSTTFNAWMTSTTGCPAAFTGGFTGFRVLAITPKDGTCSAQGKATPTVAWDEHAKLCLPAQAGRGCADHQVCMPQVSGATACGALGDPAACTGTMDPWYTGYDDQRTCGACSCGDGTPGSCAGVKVRAGANGKCSSSTFATGAGGYSCDEDMDLAPLFLEGTPTDRLCRPSAATTGELVPTGELGLCCIQL